MRKILLFFTLFIIISHHQVQAQTSGIDRIFISSELSKRGLTEQEVREKLLSKNIDIDKIKTEDLPKMRKQIEDAINELEQEKAQKQQKPQAAIRDSNPSQGQKSGVEEKLSSEAKQLSKGKAEEIKEDIARGASAEEAISKALLSNLKDSAVNIPAYVYGQNLFRDKNLGYFLDKSFKAPDTYILNVGDKLTVSISNPRVFYNQSFEIDKEGFLKLDNMPRTNLKGMTVERARKVLASNFARFYSFAQEDFQITVTAARIVTINITGDVFNPGTHTLSAGNSAFNALAAVGGPTNIGSVRNIQLFHTSTGGKVRLDVYAFLFNPGSTKDLYLYENDFIYVPPIGRVASIEGAVTRPFKYELIDGENLMKLIEYAGGLTDNAYQSTIQIKRYVDDKEKFIDVNYKDLKNSNGDFVLLKGDAVIIRKIPENRENFASVTGAVDLPGNYELTEGMRVSDLIKKSVIKKEARIDVAYLQRLNPDKTIQLKIININEILANPTSPTNFLLQSRDSLAIFYQEKFARKDFIAVGGAVRSKVNYPYDVTKTIRVNDAVNLSGGLLTTATDFAYIVRKDTSNKKNVEYVKINVRNAISKPNSSDNIILMPNDSLHILSKEDFVDEGFIKVSGSVRNPGEFKFAKSLTLSDALVMANGLKLEAAMNKVDIFRIIMNENQPLKTVVATIEVDKDFNIVDSKFKDFQLQPYDQIFVRTIPKFSLQKYVNVTGEVAYPGEYALIEENEKLSSIITRAGGLNTEAFPSGSTLYRPQDNIGFIIINLDEITKNVNSNGNIVLKEGDIIDIPKTKDIVTIKGATRASDLYLNKILANGTVNIAFDGERSAWYYIDKYAAGVNKDGRKKLIVVEQPNGTVKRTKNFFFFKVYPKVQKGSIISVGYAEKKVEKDRTPKEKTDWGKILSDTIAQTVALLSFILLIERL